MKTPEQIHRAVAFRQKALNTILNGFADSLRDGPSFSCEKDRDGRWFYQGTAPFLSKPADDARWRLGYACVDLTPTDYRSHRYYLGGYLTIENGFNNSVERVIDAMSCRIIALDDGSGRGVSLFATIDCIGLGNYDVRRIRRNLSDLIRIERPDVRLASVNVFSTHAHSCVDTQGLWTDTLKTVCRNLKKNKTGRGTYRPGADDFFMTALTRKVAQGMLDAINDLTPGTITAAKKDIGEEYFTNKNRASATALVTDLLRLVFTPDDPAKRPTVIASLGAHPDVAGLPTTDGQGTGRDLCGEYVYYMGELIGRAGYHFMFFNGAICAIYMARGASNDGVDFDHRYEQSIRYGRELARLTLAMTKTREEIEADPLLYDREEIARDTAASEKNGVPYTLWCENWSPVQEAEVPPLLNVRLKEVKIPVLNPLIRTVGKLNLVSYQVLRDGSGEYSVVTEIGYLQLGDNLNVVFVPGEYCADLLKGGASLTAEGSFNGTDFPLPTLEAVFGVPLTAFGLANDAVGYIVPDNDYVLGEFKNHYHELISLGAKTGSCVTQAFIELKEELGKQVN